MQLLELLAAPGHDGAPDAPRWSALVVDGVTLPYEEVARVRMDESMLEFIVEQKPRKLGSIGTTGVIGGSSRQHLRMHSRSEFNQWREALHPKIVSKDDATNSMMKMPVATMPGATSGAGSSELAFDAARMWVTDSEQYALRRTISNKSSALLDLGSPVSEQQRLAVCALDPFSEEAEFGSPSSSSAPISRTDELRRNSRARAEQVVHIDDEPEARGLQSVYARVRRKSKEFLERLSDGTTPEPPAQLQANTEEDSAVSPKQLALIDRALVLQDSEGLEPPVQTAASTDSGDKRREDFRSRHPSIGELEKREIATHALDASTWHGQELHAYAEGIPEDGAGPEEGSSSAEEASFPASPSKTFVPIPASPSRVDSDELRRRGRARAVRVDVDDAVDVGDVRPAVRNRIAEIERLHSAYSLTPATPAAIAPVATARPAGGSARISFRKLSFSPKRNKGVAAEAPMTAAAAATAATTAAVATAAVAAAAAAAVGAGDRATSLESVSQERQPNPRRRKNSREWLQELDVPQEKSFPSFTGSEQVSRGGGMLRFDDDPVLTLRV